MNSNNLYLVEHQHQNPNNNPYRTNNIQPIVTQMKSNIQTSNGTNLLTPCDKVIFKVESSEPLITNTPSNFKQNNNYTNQLNNSINNNNYNIGIKQMKMNNNINSTMIIKEEASEPCIAHVGAVLASPQCNENDPRNLNIYVNNVVCSYSVRCHLNLRRIAMEGKHVEYKKENGMVNMKLRKPYTTSTIWSSGKITCAGAKSEPDAYVAARRFCRILQKMKFKVRLTNYRVVNVLATCTVPFGVDIQKLAEHYQKECSYEPELHPGATFKIAKLKATLKLFTTGSITLTAPSVIICQDAINEIYPILVEYKRNFPNEQQSNSSQSFQMKSEPFQVKLEPSMNGSTPTSATQIKYHNHHNNVTNELKPDIMNYQYNNNTQQNGMKQITKTTPSITSISTQNFQYNKPSTHHQNISNQQKPNHVVTSSFNVNVPTTCHQIIPSNLYNPQIITTQTYPHSMNNVNASSILNNNNITYQQHSSIPTIHVNSFNHVNNLSNPISNNSMQSPSIISSNSFPSSLGGLGGSLSQPSNGWFYDSLLNDDFLP